MSANFHLCYITDRRSLASESIERRIHSAIEAGIDAVQIREKDLPARTLLALAGAAAERARGSRCRIIVNDRLDVALASESHGVHLGTRSMPLQAARCATPKGFLIGASCHSLEEAIAADSGGADYILLGPIFETPSKAGYGPPLGVERLAEVAEKVRVPVLALGGITVERVATCLNHGATGIAGIRLFQEGDSIAGRVRDLLKIFDAVGKPRAREVGKKSF